MPSHRGDKCFRPGESYGKELLRNVWDNSVVSSDADAVNKTALRVRNQSCGSPENVVSNYLSAH
jgi:hypothetical protein